MPPRHFAVRRGANLAKGRFGSDFAQEEEEEEEDEGRDLGLDREKRKFEGVFGSSSSEPRELKKRHETVASKANYVSLTGLPSQATPTWIRELVGEFGEVESVEIQTEFMMYKGTTAVVGFRDAQAAEKTKLSLDGKYIGQGSWVYAAIGRDVSINTRLTPISGHPFNAKSDEVTGSLVIKVENPMSLERYRLLNSMVEHVVRHGPDFEAIIMQREQQNPDFAFLFDSGSSEHHYYRWKLFSIMSTDDFGADEWDLKSKPMFRDGILWIPPTTNWSLDDEIDRIDNEDGEGDYEDHGQKHPGGTPWLGPILHLHLTLLLQHLTIRRGAIARLMAFSVDNSYAADEIVDVICASVVSSFATVPQRIARLYAIGDILYNSGMGVVVSKGIWRYRLVFQSKLVAVFKDLRQIYQAFDGRIRADNFRRQVTNILDVWEGWNVFATDVLDTMRSSFLTDSETVGRDQDGETERSGQPAQRSSFKLNKWKKVEKSSDAESDIQLPQQSKNAQSESIIDISTLIDPELDGDPMTDTDTDTDIEIDTDTNTETDNLPTGNDPVKEQDT
ncbi:uncharacterized protein V1516DRAFT_662482 [Lipomyces oligophaga]|uniref:uncharacterized protein n=1 Tax=Lipomyces oligophaga TaxID=45792 RepID=UPI0034CE465F